jgi:hypothetical protein
VEDQVGYIPIFKEPGVGVMQITYNTQNLSGAGCYERHDTGLSGFGSQWHRRIFPTRLARHCQAVHEFLTTAQGYRFSTSNGGVLTGRGADIS